ncbi:methyltransferase type 11 [Pyrenophora seminiperda CCB06]|uniref:Methyltransferase type 11 n=1 Tax=Pyrenophora seminiperda CCB06 TaxID=1302712 RepID=A0A3M7LVV3_9PLEO|nr:methyltransferase type 11 [Pyrenophora seminiperda CCB06]
MAAVTTPFDSSKDVFAKDKAFWNNYLKGRPSAPDVFFERLFRYHQKHHGKFSTVHDAGAGNGPYANKLRSKFQHVIISDIAPDNVAFAKDRLGTDGFSYRAARVEEGDDIPDGSVDMVFATNVMHFCDQKLAMEIIAKQLRSGGTFACAAFGAAHFEDPRVQDIYVRMGQTGARALLKTLNDPEKLIAAMARTKGAYNVAPLDEALFLPGAQRIHLNMPEGGMTSPLPPEMPVSEPVHTSTSDVEVFEMEDGWSFVTDLDGVREHIASFPFGRDKSALFAELWREMEDVVKDQPVKGHWPAKIILATRR